jgi:hypothetical protein
MTAVNTLYLPLAVNDGTDAEELGLKMWVGEVAGAFYQSSVTEGLFDFKTIGGGATEAQWIVTGRRGSEYHTRGEDLLTDQSAASADYVKHLNTAEVTVKFDRPLDASSFLDRQDSILSHYPHQTEMRRQSGQTLARTIDLHRLICIARGAHRHEVNGNNVDDGVFVDGVKDDTTDHVTAFGSATFATGASEDPDATQEYIALMAERFDNLEVPEERVMFVNPSVYHYILQYLDDYVDRDYGGEGSRARAMIPYIHGFRVIKTTNMPSGTIAHPAGAVGGSSGNKYAIKAAGLSALFATRDALAEVRLGSGFQAESEYLTWRKGTLVSLDWTGGMKELRPECCGAIYNDTIPSNPND